MKFTGKILAAVLISSVSVSCEDYLDPKIDESYGDEITWKLPDYAMGVLVNAYHYMEPTPCKYDGNNYLDVATDNAVTNDFTSKLYRYVSGGQSATDDPLNEWSASYGQIRNVNLFLENGLGDNIIYDLTNETVDQDMRKRLKGEAYFLRAWWEMNLLQKYGGITDDGEALGYCIVEKSITEEERVESLKIPRNTYEECVQQILDDCDSAILYLSLKFTGNDAVWGSANDGRANARAAYALRSRAALYAASPVYQPEGQYAESDEALTRKWERAVRFAAEALDASAGNIGKYTALKNNMLVGSGVKDKTNDELLLRKWFNNNNMEKYNFPPLFYGAGKTNPSQNLVNAYPMKNGFPITDARSGYDPQNPYINRDNRFALTFYCNGDTFNSERPLEIYTDEDGDKGRDAAGYDYRNTRTGYYLRKGLSTKSQMLYNPSSLGASNDYHQTGLLRRAEVYYNLAEALNRLYGPYGTDPYNRTAYTAYEIIRTIREANGITSTEYLDEVAAAGKDAFHQLILNERRIEFAFENMRFFDLRRNLLPLDEPVLGIRITRTGDALVFEGTNPGVDDIIVEERLLDDPKYYYCPIPYNETVKNSNLKQNKGW